MYNIAEGTTEVHSRFVPDGTNNSLEHLGLLGALRRAGPKALIITDSELAPNQVTGAFSVNSTHLGPLVEESRRIHQSKMQAGHHIVFARMKGHKGTSADGKVKVPNHADPQCTYTIARKEGTGDESFLDFDLSKLVTSASSSWLIPNPISIYKIYTPQQLSDMWSKLQVGDQFSVQFTHVAHPTDMACWTGEKLSHTEVRYALPDGLFQTHPWPPIPEIRVHALQQQASCRKKKPHTRLKHNAPSLVVPLDISGMGARLRTMGPQEWVEWTSGLPSRRVIPASWWPAWSTVVRRFIQTCNLAQDEDEFVDAALALLALPKLYLDTRMKDTLCHDNLSQHKPSVCLPGAPPKYLVKIDEDEKAAVRCQKLCDEKNWKKGVKALGRNRVLDGSLPEVRSTLNDKHVAPSDGVDFVMFEPPLDIPPYLAHEVEEAHMRTACGAAPGWSGWTKELFGAACRTDPQLYTEWGIFLHRLQGCSHPRLRDIARAGLLFALDNAKNPGDAPDPRPITISEFFTKLIANIAMKKSGWHMHPSQRGVGHPGGTSQAIVEVQQTYESLLGTVVATFDIKNAFNSLRRAAIHAKLRQLGPAGQYLMEYFRWMYGREAEIFVRANGQAEKYRSREGVRQGDMVASLLFCLAFTDAAVAAGYDVFGADVAARLWLYCDDVTIVATVDEVLRFKKRLEHHLTAHTIDDVRLGVDLNLNMKKSRVLADRCSESELCLLREAGFQLDFGCTRVLGSPVGSTEARRLWIANKCAGWQCFWERLRHDALRPSTVITIASRCGNVKFEHLAKSLPPEVTLEAAAVFDANVDAVIKYALAIKEPVHQCVLRPTVNIRPYAIISPAIYESTLALCERRFFSVRQATKAALQAHYASLSQLPLVERHVLATQGSTAVDTLRCSAPVPAKRISDHQFAQGMRLRLGVLPSHMPVTCPCGFSFGKVPAPIAAINHMLTCEDNHGATTVTRHNGVLQAMLDVMAAYGIVSTMKCRDLHHDLIPDMRIISLPRQVIIDLTIVDGVHRGLGAVDDAADFKREKYTALAEQKGMRFFAVPMSTYGHMHQEAINLVNHVADHIHIHRRAAFREDMRCAMQHALLAGNSDVVDQYLCSFLKIQNDF